MIVEGALQDMMEEQKRARAAFVAARERLSVAKARKALTPGDREARRAYWEAYEAFVSAREDCIAVKRDLAEIRARIRNRR